MSYTDPGDPSGEDYTSNGNYLLGDIGYIHAGYDGYGYMDCDIDCWNDYQTGYSDYYAFLEYYDNMLRKLGMISFVTTIVIWVASLVGCVLMFVLMTSTKYRKQSFSVLLCVQSVIDLLTLGVITIIEGLTLYSVFYAEEHISLAYHVMTALPLASIWMLVLITIDRFIAMVYPLKHRIWVTQRRVGLASAVIIILSGLFPLVWSYKKYPGFVGKLPEYIAMSFVPVAIISALNAKIVATVRKSAKQRANSYTEGNNVAQSGDSNRDGNRGTAGSVTLKTTVSLSIVVTVSVLTYVPECIYDMVSPYSPDNRVVITLSEHTRLQIIDVVLVLLRKVNYSINFYLMMAVGSTYRPDLAAIVCRRRN